MTEIRDEESSRPSPEALLNEAQREGRGKLKIFLGASPGVGKTYKMLTDSNRDFSLGRDVVIGIVESHGRSETDELCRGLTALPRKSTKYRGREFDELDLDAVLERKPEIVLVDELAHTNIPGSRHEKRYQDVLEILDAGINVYTTLNVQHLESLNDIVEAICHVKVRETVPDSILDTADEITLIDLPPDELIQRLNKGKVYFPEAAQKAIHHFFNRGNLMALRELAMRAAAHRVGTGFVNYMKTRGIEGPLPTQERILTCIDASPDCERLVRFAKRLADQRAQAWMVIFVETPREDISAKDRLRIQETLGLAESLGAQAITVPGVNVASEIIAFANDHNVTQILLSRPRTRSSLQKRLFPSVADRLLRHSDRFHITLASRFEQDQSPFRTSDKIRKDDDNPFCYRPFVEPILLVALVISIGYPLRTTLQHVHFSMIFVIIVLLSALRNGIAPALFTSALSFLGYNFFFTVPLYSLSIRYQEDWATLILMLIISIVTGHLAGRTHTQVLAVRSSARTSALLYNFSRRIASAMDTDDLAWSVCEYLSESLGHTAIVLLVDENRQLQLAAGKSGKSDLTEGDRAAARWALDHNEPAGKDSGTLPACRWYFIPIRTGAQPQGVIGITGHEFRWNLTTEQKRLAIAMRDQMGLALERLNLLAQMEKSVVAHEQEKLRTALLSSVSHDLRTPLSTIIGSTSVLIDMNNRLSGEKQLELYGAIMEEAERLNRFVQNLLDMTRLGYGALVPKRQWCDLRDLIGNATGRLKNRLSRYRLQIDVPPDFAWISVDPELTEQILVNLLDNAAKYSPPETCIRIESHFAGILPVVLIIDQGCGIPEEERDKVFDMFSRVQATDSQVAGTGLGLAICRGFIQAMGGSITAKSGPDGRGTVMEFTLPSESDLPPDSHRKVGE